MKHTAQGSRWLGCFLSLITECGIEADKCPQVGKSQIQSNSWWSRKCRHRQENESQSIHFFKVQSMLLFEYIMTRLSRHLPKKVPVKSLTKTDTYLKWDEVWFLSGRHSAASPETATAWCAPGPVAPSLCALWFWPSELLLPFSKPSWHTAFQYRDH